MTILFFAVQFFADPVRAVDRTLWWLLVFFGLALLALVGWTFSVPAENRATASDLSMIAGMILPGVATIIVHWLFVR
ncbi:MAG: hypothetical protein E5W59_31270, partial [Mesorhizobium sp.]